MPDTTPTPLTAILAAADDAKRAHDRLCDLAETLLPESSPVKTADNPAPVVLPTVDEVARTIMLDDGCPLADEEMDPAYLSNARAVLDLIAARVPVWVPIEWDAIRPGMLVRGTRPGYRIELTVGRIDGSTVRGVGGGTWMRTLNDETATWEVDPRTVPAEPEDPAVKAIQEWALLPWQNAETGEIAPAAATDLLARIDAARADQ